MMSSDPQVQTAIVLSLSSLSPSLSLSHSKCLARLEVVGFRNIYLTLFIEEVSSWLGESERVPCITLKYKASDSDTPYFLL